MFFFFFSSRRRHTRSDRDWSSDVCSSDLERLVGLDEHVRVGAAAGRDRGVVVDRERAEVRVGRHVDRRGGGHRGQIGRAAGRGREEISGGAGSFKKKKKKQNE